MSKISAAITAVGAYVPEYVLTNQMLEKMVDTNDEWITTRTGIKERRILKEDGKGTSFLAINAAKDLINKTGLDPKEIDLVIVATASPDMKAASTAAYTATQIGATNAFSFDLEAACSSFLFGMSTASSYIESGRYKKILLIGADKMSSIINYKDRATCIIFGDGAGAVLFEPNNENLGLQDEYLRTDGSGREFLQATYGGSSHSITHEVLDNGGHYAFQEGRRRMEDQIHAVDQALFKIKTPSLFHPVAKNFASAIGVFFTVFYKTFCSFKNPIHTSNYVTHSKIAQISITIGHTLPHSCQIPYPFLQLKRYITKRIVRLWPIFLL